jgi:dipeptidyl-peptidase-3
VRSIASSSKEALDALDTALAAGLFACLPKMIGFVEDGGQSQYYPSDIPLNKLEVQTVGRILTSHGIPVDNTRIRKEGGSTYSVMLASAETRTPRTISSTADPKFDLTLESGDFAAELSNIAEALRAAIDCVPEGPRRDYLHHLLLHIRHGDIDEHRQASVHWVHDAGPPVETILGFIEAYRDPSGTRREWMGLVALQNKAQTTVLGKLGDRAEELISKLPWVKPGEYGLRWGPFENEQFVKPDFVSLDGKYSVPVSFPSCD